MTFLNFSHVRISEEFLAHVLTGEEGNAEKGGHLSGLRRENKTEFPPEWDEEHIRQALESVLESPQYVEILGYKVVLSRIVAGVNIQIVLISRQSALMPFAAYPTGGPGVIQNIMGVQHPLPLHNPRNGR